MQLRDTTNGTLNEAKEIPKISNVVTWLYDSEG